MQHEDIGSVNMRRLDVMSNGTEVGASREAWRQSVHQGSLRVRIIRIGLALSMLMASSAGLAVEHSGKEVSLVHSPTMGHECVFFLLAGVAQADPAAPGVAWFAVHKTHPGFKELTAILVSARLTKERVTVYTNGNHACGVAAVDAISM